MDSKIALLKEVFFYVLNKITDRAVFSKIGLLGFFVMGMSIINDVESMNTNLMVVNIEMPGIAKS